METKKLFLATNGYTHDYQSDLVTPARAQALITQPIPGLKIKGTFHLDQGYYYFRNIDQRILLGGGRNLDFEGEKTTLEQTTLKIQNALEELLQQVILPNQKIEIAQRWSGIMGVGAQKKPIIKQLEPHVYCGVRLGGMGVAIGAEVGQNLAELASEET
jgi:glycine/D-amino acid oxidase-like deaminating enzyme